MLESVVVFCLVGLAACFVCARTVLRKGSGCACGCSCGCGVNSACAHGGGSGSQE